MTLDEIMPSFDMDWIRETCRHDGAKVMNRLVDDVQVNVDKVKKTLVENALCLYVVNHQTQLDYFVPTYAILKNDLPYPRKVAGSNLNNWFVRNFMFDFRPWGIIWHDRYNESKRAIRDYISALIRTFKEDNSVLGFPEGSRNRNIRGKLKEFKTGFFGAALHARREIGKPIYIVCIGCDYDCVPERGYWERIDNSKSGRVGYFGWDVYAFNRWRFFERNKGVARVNFAEPVEILEMAEEGSRKEQAVNVAERARRIVGDLLLEVRGGVRLFL